jgi:hypothetical protein
MPAAYNPITRAFYQFRAGLVTNLGVARHEVLSGTSVDALLPLSTRREVCTQLRQQGFRLPPLELSQRDRRRDCWIVLVVFFHRRRSRPRPGWRSCERLNVARDSRIRIVRACSGINRSHSCKRKASRGTLLNGLDQQHFGQSRT